MNEVEFFKLDNFMGLGKAIKMHGYGAEVIVTIDIGPRIIHFSKKGSKNILAENVKEETALPDGRSYKVYGGHRLSHSPESFPRSYIPDNDPLMKYEKLDCGIRLYQNVEEWTQIQKIMEICMLPNRIKVTNKLLNKGAWPIKVSVWPITVVSPDGLEVCPVTQRYTGLLPNTYYVLWAYSRANDPRLKWGQKYIIVRGNHNNTKPFKLGYLNEYGWVAYFYNEMLFIKKFSPPITNAMYPDFGCNYETYTAEWGTELETLSPLQVVNPDETVEQVEEWYLFRSSFPSESEDDVSLKLSDFAEASGIELP